ncbi:hypothetical protein, conserved [Trypanosoma brucei gambiense DAL972]|uniref:Uncharacterized protein n=1 Tax=Trypanosoma brucei gambiense (strain MHOM/CI/86/DAL972) TaxID=679716 RepID=D0A133_TRYB9|nr:hypothetical protein, conserved [Trypanosoma brucei gambiense DAL972]CBH14975.1 hypothetical protein, conserved [Trypanosoma brucei gambiense DAL972]|eukprot:XP_011777241.1 hypothetical protein, conserved [Trypanosoma brucei gambiense DAL972]
MLLQCGSCSQRIACCPGCGGRCFTFTDGRVAPITGVAPITATSVSVAITESPTPTTAFELFCQDTTVQEEALAANRIEGETDITWAAGGRKRVLAEMWLSADTPVRRRYEEAAREGRKGVDLQAASGGDLSIARQKHAGDPTQVNNSNHSSSSGSSKGKIQPPGAPVGAVPDGKANKTSKKSKQRTNTPTAYQLFCKRNNELHKSNRAAVFNAWKAMGAAEKEPFDIEAAQLRVSLQK